MGYLEELCDLVMLHARAQNMDMGRCGDILGQVNSVEHESAGSWAFEWMAAANQFYAQGRAYEAYQYFNLARFPYPLTSLMREAHRSCVSSFNEWIKDVEPRVERCCLQLQGCDIPFYFYPDEKAAGKTLLVMGGIVSLKEQWGQFLVAGKKLGMSVIVAEMPGVGENPLRYDESAYGYISALLDAVSSRANVNHVHCVMMSFSGNLALRQVQFDQRIKAITSVGAPIQAFFLDNQWWGKVPVTTKRTLAYLCRQDDEHLFDYLSRFALTDEEIKKINVPVHYVQSMRDEIIPAEDANVLKTNAQVCYVHEFDDVHGSPHHMSEIQKLVPWTIFRESLHRPLFKNILGFSLFIKKLKRNCGF